MAAHEYALYGATPAAYYDDPDPAVRARAVQASTYVYDWLNNPGDGPSVEVLTKAQDDPRPDGQGDRRRILKGVIARLGSCPPKLTSIATGTYQNGRPPRGRRNRCLYPRSSRRRGRTRSRVGAGGASRRRPGILPLG